MRRREVHDAEVESLVIERAGLFDERVHVGRVEAQVRRRDDLGRVASDVLAVPVEHLALLSQRLDATAREVPVLRPARHGAQRPLLATTTDDDGWVWLLHGLGFAVGVRE